MSNIKISNLQPAGAALFFGSEDLANSFRDLSEDELRIRGGKGYSNKSYSSKSYSNSYKNKSYY